MHRPAFATALLLAFLPLAASAQDLKDLVRQTQDSVVKLTVFDRAGRELGSGSGFFVAGDLVVTNLHVVDGAQRVEAALSDRATIDVAGLAAADASNDLAILKVDAESRPPLSLARSPAEAGERVVVLGSPFGLAGSLSEGIVSAVRAEGLEDIDDMEVPLLQITAAISPGSSGSPVMNLRGEVIGVAVSQVLFAQNLNFAVPVRQVRRLLERVDRERIQKTYQARTPSGGAGAYLRNVLVSLLIFAAILFAIRRMK